MSGVQYSNVEKSSSSGMMSKVLVALGVVTFCGVFANVGLVHQMQKDVDHIVQVWNRNTHQCLPSRL